MKASRSLLVLVLATAALALFSGCDRLWGVNTPEGNVGLLEYPGPAHVVCLLAQDSCQFGTLTIWNDDTNIYFRFTSLGAAGWFLRRTRLAAGLALEDIPHNGQGRPIPGRFQCKATHHPLHRVGSFDYTIPLNGWSPGTTVYVAGEAQLYRSLGGSVEFAWAGCCRFPCPEWACYTTYVIKEPTP